MNEMVVGFALVVVGMGFGVTMCYVALRMGIKIGWDAANQDEPLKKPDPPLRITDTE